MEPLRPNESRARVAIFVIWMVMTIGVLIIISNLLKLDTLKAMGNGERITDVTMNISDIRTGILGLLGLTVNIISIVTFIRWFRRAYFNLGIKARRLSWGDDQTAWAWFIPIFNLYRPYQIMDELYEETRELLARHNIHSSQRLRTSMVGWWWALWIISGIAASVVFWLDKHALTIEDRIINTEADIFSDLILIPLSIITIKVIRDYSVAATGLAEINASTSPLPADEAVPQEAPDPAP